MDDEDSYALLCNGSKPSYGGKSSNRGRSYGKKSFGDKEEIIEEVRIVKDIVFKKSPVKSYGQMFFKYNFFLQRLYC